MLEFIPSWCTRSWVWTSGQGGKPFTDLYWVLFLKAACLAPVYIPSFVLLFPPHHRELKPWNVWLNWTCPSFTSVGPTLSAILLIGKLGQGQGRKTDNCLSQTPLSDSVSVSLARLNEKGILGAKEQRMQSWAWAELQGILPDPIGRADSWARGWGLYPPLVISFPSLPQSGLHILPEWRWRFFNLSDYEHAKIRTTCL